jgi:hypothetical protein
MRLLAAPLLAVVCAVASAQEAPALSPVDFSGRWETTFGALDLAQNGSRVDGTYTDAGYATLWGTLKARRLTFLYEEATAAGEGWFELSADGRSFAGLWRVEDGEWAEWTGTLVSRARARGPYDGLFATGKGRIRLVQNEGAPVHGTYSYAGTLGTIRGQVRDGALRFTWREASSHGEGEFTLSADGKRIDGQWRSATGKEGAWKGKRVVARPKVQWLMILEAQWENSLVDQEYSFGAMLRAYFRRYPHVQVRHRRFGDRPDFVRGAREVALFGEPVVLVVASHGEAGKLIAGSDRIDPKELGEILNDAPNVKLVHFSSCELMIGDVPESIQKQLDRRIPLSGYAISVDWSASAVLEFLYFDLVLGRHMNPAKAAALVRKELAFAGDEGTPGSPLGGSHFRFVE